MNRGDHSQPEVKFEKRKQRTSMSVPDIHTCLKLTSENERLRKKIFQIKQQRDEYLLELNGMKHKTELENLLRSKVTTRESCTQTESKQREWHPLSKPLSQVTDQRISDTEKTNKLLSMHNQLMRRYEKEVKLSLGHLDTITELNMKICEMEKQFKDEKDKCQRLERELIQLRINKPKSWKDDDGGSKLNKAAKEWQKLHKENEKLKGELKGLDFGFFEEIEDIKYSLQQSTKLNVEYERTLKKLCKKFGVPYPYPMSKIK